MANFGTAQPIRRVEDQRLLTGQGRYTDDINLPGQAYAIVLRSPHAHARILSLDTQAAQALPGVLGVFTAADLAADGVGPLPCVIPLKNRDGSDRANPARTALAQDVVRHVGDGVAFIVAETLAQARDAAEQVEIDYEPLPAVAEVRAAIAAGAPGIHAEAAGNLCFDWAAGEAAKADAGFAKAAHVARIELVNNRIIVSSMEARGALADFDPASGRFTLHTSTQGSHMLRGLLAEAVFRLPEKMFRIVPPDVGGGFGMKLFLYPEHVLTAFAARRLGRPVKWTADRTDAFLSDTQGRDNFSRAEMALDKDGRILALRVSTLANLGAHLSTFAPFIPTIAGTRVLSGLYAMPAIHVEVKGVFTNTVPVDAYRGAGRPEANYLVERLMDKAAREIGLTPDEIRRRNFIQPSALPFTTVMGLTYDSGAFEENMTRAMATADWTGLAARDAAARRAGRRRGIGMACYLEATAGMTEERAEIRFEADGMVSVLVGTQSTGQGHETAYTQVVSDHLGVPHDRIRIIQGDSDAILSGGGTGGARSLYSEGGAITNASDLIIAKGKVMAGHVLEAAAADIEFAAGRFRIAGTDRDIGILELAAFARDPAKRPPELGESLDAAAKYTVSVGTFPNGCHIAEVEVDEATGQVILAAYTVVDDMGRVINPMIVEGQAHGGVAQGVGQALLEHTVYGADGQLVSGSFMDYCLPRADDLPMIRFALNEVPCTTNPLGVKGAGEAGAVGSPPAVINALVDALKDLGIDHIDMPATPERGGRVMAEARANV